MANEKRLIDADTLKSLFHDRYDRAFMQMHSRVEREYWDGVCCGVNWGVNTITDAPTVDAVELPCSVGDTVYGWFGHYGKKIHECKVIKSKVCQFRDRTLHYFLDVEFEIIDPFYRDGRLMRCMQQAVFGEDFGRWDRVYRTFEEAAVALAKMDGDGNGT